MGGSQGTANQGKFCSGVAQFLYSLICRHGVPKKVQSDQGREFVNSVNSHLFKITGVKHIITLAYHPLTNGLIERVNRTIQSNFQRSLLKMVKQNENEWENYLDSVLFVYRTSKQASAKFSPFFLLYGREPRFPMDLIIGDCKLVIMYGLLNNLVDAGRGKGFGNI